MNKIKNFIIMTAVAMSTLAFGPTLAMENSNSQNTENIISQLVNILCQNNPEMFNNGQGYVIDMQALGALINTVDNINSNIANDQETQSQTSNENSSTTHSSTNVNTNDQETQSQTSNENSSTTHSSSQNIENRINQLVNILRQNNPEMFNSGQYGYVVDMRDLSALMNSIDNINLNIANNQEMQSQTSNENSSTAHSSINVNSLNIANNQETQNQTSNENSSTAHSSINVNNLNIANNQETQNISLKTQQLIDLCTTLLKNAEEMKRTTEFNESQLSQNNLFFGEQQESDVKSENYKKIEALIEKIRTQKNLLDLSANLNPNKINSNINNIKEDIKNLVIESIKIESTKYNFIFSEAIKGSFMRSKNLSLKGIHDVLDKRYNDIFNILDILEGINYLKNKKINKDDKDDLCNFNKLQNEIKTNYYGFLNQIEDINKNCLEDSKKSIEDRFEKIDYYLETTKNMVSTVEKSKIKLTNLLFDWDLIEYIDLCL